MTPFFSSYQNVLRTPYISVYYVRISLKLDSTVYQSPRKERLDFEWVIDDVMMRMAGKESPGPWSLPLEPPALSSVLPPLSARTLALEGPAL